MDLCFDWAENRSRLTVLAIRDEFTKEVLALEAATSIRSLHVQAVLARLFKERCGPKFLRSDNGPEFLSKAGSQSRFIARGSPWQNGHAESLVSRLRAELLDVEVFLNLADAQMKPAVFRRFYYEERPHSSLGCRPPAEAMSSSTKGDYS